MKKELLYTLFICLFAFGFAACGDDDDDKSIDEAWRDHNIAVYNRIVGDPEYRALSLLGSPGEFIRYKVLEEGDGEERILYGDKFKCNYVGSYIDEDGEEVIFDQANQIDNTLSDFTAIVNNGSNGGLIRGFAEAVQRMVIGDKWEIWIPQQFAYGEDGYGDSIPPYTTLKFVIEIVEITPQ